MFSAAVVFYFKYGYKADSTEERVGKIEIRQDGFDTRLSKVEHTPQLNSQKIDNLEGMMQEVLKNQREDRARQDKMYELIFKLAEENK